MRINGETKCTKNIFHCQIIGGLIMKSYTPSHHYFSIWYFLFLRGIKNRFFLTYKRHFIVPLWERIFHYDGLISHIIINIENIATWETLSVSVCLEWTSSPAETTSGFSKVEEIVNQWFPNHLPLNLGTLKIAKDHPWSCCCSISYGFCCDFYVILYNKILTYIRKIPFLSLHSV